MKCSHASHHLMDSRALPGCVWVKQFRASLRWILAFWDGIEGDITRVFRVNAYLRLGVQVDIVTDASPWGLGAWLRVNGVVRQYFAVPLEDELRVFDIQSGDCAGQQVWESLCCLVALRVWATWW